jgi:2-polyprenyl-3-methyl-5-hydroxy-6-metoxy-1,4-benzoquinol methylase
MNSKSISRYLGKSVMKRRIGFHIIYITTLWEWYIRRQLWKVLAKQNQSFVFLDAGSGMGQHAFAVAKKYSQAQVMGLEMDGEQVDDCNTVAQKLEYSNIRFKKGNLVDFNYKHAFDVILCSHILEHIEDDVTVIKALYKGLKKNGTLIIYVPTSECRVFASLGRTIHRMMKKAGARYPHQHVRYYTASELRRKLVMNGFRINSMIITYGPYGRLAYDIVTTVQYSVFFKILFPFYLLFLHPFVLVLMWADYQKQNREGSGLLMSATKDESLHNTFNYLKASA